MHSFVGEMQSSTLVTSPWKSRCIAPTPLTPHACVGFLPPPPAAAAAASATIDVATCSNLLQKEDVRTDTCTHPECRYAPPRDLFIYLDRHSALNNMGELLSEIAYCLFCRPCYQEERVECRGGADHGGREG